MNTKQLNRILARAAYGVVIVAMVFSISTIASAASESSRVQIDGPPTLAWLQVNEDGFGDSQNQQIPSLAAFGNYLYAGTWNAVWENNNVAYATAQIWRTPDGANWELVNEIEANGAAALIVYKGYLYSGSWSNEDWGWGGKIWRSKDGVNWEPVGGFENGNGIARFAVFKNALYASTWSAGSEIWRTTNGIDWELFAAPGWDYPNNGGAISSEVFNGFLYWGVPNWATGAQIWRTDGISVESITTNGFGSTDNSAISSLAAFNDYLYAGLWNSQGVQVWRSINGTDWEQVSGLGSTSSGNTNNALEVYMEQLYLVLENDSTGLEVWRTPDGLNWQQVGFAGFGDGNNQWSYWDNATTVFKGNLFIATNNFATGGEIWKLCPTGCKNVPVGDRISVFDGGEIEFPAETPFHIMHGFQLSSDDRALGIYDFELDVDGIPQKEDFKIFWKDDSNQNSFRKLWVYNFPDGMTGIHEFTGHWFAPCQYATDYTDPCPTPNAKVETRTQTLIVTFIFPPLNLRVNYGDDWVESFYKAGHEVLITVTDEDGNVKATAIEWTEPKDFWNWEEGFQTGRSDWVDGDGNPMGSPPDILPGDWVYGDVNNGVSAQVQIGEISGFIDLASDSISGEIFAPFATELALECFPWGAPEPIEMRFDTLYPDEEGIYHYSCSWAGEWDIQPGQVVGVGYFGSDGNWVANTFCVPMPTFVAYLPWAIEGYDWPMDDTIKIYINDQYIAQSVSEQRSDFPEGTTRVLFDVGQSGVILQTNDHIVMTDESIDFSKEVLVTNLAVSDFDPNAGQVFGTYDPSYDLWVWLYDVEGQVPETNPDNATWVATFTELPLGAWGGATQWDWDGDGTSVDFQVPQIPYPSVIITNQPGWVDSGITVSNGQSVTIEAFGLMNPCLDTYPNGADYCIFYRPWGMAGEVPDENEFGIFPGPGLGFMALLGRIGGSEPFYVGAGGTFTADEPGTLWLTPNDNLRTDNQGAYRVWVWFQP